MEDRFFATAKVSVGQFVFLGLDLFQCINGDGLGYTQQGGGTHSPVELQNSIRCELPDEGELSLLDCSPLTKMPTLALLSLTIVTKQNRLTSAQCEDGHRATFCVVYMPGVRMTAMIITIQAKVGDRFG